MTTFKVGDTVTVFMNGNIERITRLTPGPPRTRGKLTAGPHTVRADNGSVVTNSMWHSGRIVPTTDEHRRTIKMINARRSLNAVKWARMSDELVMQVFALVKAERDTP